MGLLFATALLAGAAVAEQSSKASSFCCSALGVVGLADRLLFPGIEAYDTRLDHYFSQSARSAPGCFLQPQNTAEVSLAIKTLVEANKTEPCHFAVRSGGHTHYAGAAGIEDGVTIDLSNMNNVVYHPENETVSAMPGAVWGDVYAYLDSLDPPKMVVGGRSASVGLGGLILGGGNSYHAARYGMVCDNVLQFEVVLADGSIVTASADENADLFKVLKGGSSNFGIVTRFDLRAFEGGNIFGGLVLYEEWTVAEQFQALLNFGEKIQEDPYGSAIVISVYMSALPMPMFMNAFEYTAPVERPAVFDEFFAIGNKIDDTTGLRNMTSLAEELEQPKTRRVSFSTLTFGTDMRVLKKAHAAFKTVVALLEKEATGDWAVLTLYQPLPASFAKLSTKNGGNVLGLDRFEENLILYEPYLKWENPEEDELFESQAQWLRDEISSYAVSIGQDNEFIYLDYADKVQDPLKSYGPANVAKMRAAARKYDPEGVFQSMLLGGFKISKVADFGDEDEVYNDEL